MAKKGVTQPEELCPRCRKPLQTEKRATMIARYCATPGHFDSLEAISSSFGRSNLLALVAAIGESSAPHPIQLTEEEARQVARARARSYYNEPAPQRSEKTTVLSGITPAYERTNERNVPRETIAQTRPAPAPTSATRRGNNRRT